VESGQVYGFLGLNGAGKSSTIRILLSLIYPTSGTAYLFDTPVRESVAILRDKVGALVEEATFYPFMTGFDNLRVLAQTSACDASKEHINSVLDMLGMLAFAHRKTKTYSTGMKQRLGVAAALLNNPDMLILDEPTSGLDPKGIQEMRDMLQNLAKNEGKTIFLSSHLLHEVEQSCDRVAIIQRGSLLQEGTVSELLGEEAIVQIRATPFEKASQLLSEHFPLKIVNDTLEITARHEDIPAIVQTLASNEIAIYEVTQKHRSLEDLFLELTDD
jgi:ABC-2 type transport system ATP-binding protein